MGETTPAEELRAAATTLRSSVFVGVRYSTGNVAALMRARGPLADWLEHEAEMAAADHLWAEREPCGWCGSPAGQHVLAIAREINGGPR